MSEAFKSGNNPPNEEERDFSVFRRPAAPIYSRPLKPEAKAPEPERTESAVGLAEAPGEEVHEEREYSVFNRPAAVIRSRPMNASERQLFYSQMAEAVAPPVETVPLPATRGVEKPERGVFLAGLYSMLLLLGAFLTLTVANQVATLTTYIEAFPEWLQIPAWTVLGIVLAVLAVAMVRVSWFFFILPRSPNVPMKALNDLQSRAETREQAAEGAAEAAGRIRAFLETYPVETKGGWRRKPFSFSPDEVNTLVQRRRALLTAERGDAFSWLQQFDQQFLSVLDQRAVARVAAYSKVVFLKTALISNPLFETAVILANSYLMIGDLCRIYNLTVSRIGAMTILMQTVFAAVVAANVEDALDHAIDAAGDSIHDFGTTVAIGVAGTLPVVKRGVKGWVAYKLVRRLGTVAVRELRPIRKA